MKLLIVGDGGVGKTIYRKILENKGFEQKYVATLGVDNCSISYNDKNFDIWDTAGTEKFSGLKDGYYIGSNCAIIMVSDNKLTTRNVDNYRSSINKLCGNIPIVVVVNKCELNGADNVYNELVDKGEDPISISCSQNISINAPLDKLIEMLN